MESFAERSGVPAQTLEWVLEAMGKGSRLLSVEGAGGSWHANHFVEVADARGTRLSLVLSVLARSEVPAPAVVAADPEGDVCDVPAILLTRLPGRPPTQPHDMDVFVRELASMLPLVHAVDGEGAGGVPAYRRYVEPDRIEYPSWLPRSVVWGEVFEAVGTAAAPDGPRCFIHRDYHPGNTLWSDHRLTAAVDWTQGSWGPPQVDLGHMRWNLAAEYGVDVAESFLRAHREVASAELPDQAYWDLVALVDVVANDHPGWIPPAEIARLERYAALVLGRL
jgi:aminoglycoside phosphotransferase (APT) family kinase protein